MLVFFIALCVFLIGFMKIKENGGLRNNLLISFVLGIYLIYLFITPFYFYSTGRDHLMDIRVEPYFYLEASLIYSVAIITLLLGYFLIGKKTKETKVIIVLNQNKKINRKSFILFLVFYSVIIINSIAGGINYSALTQDLDQSLMGFDGASNYFQNLVDSLIILILLGIYFRQKFIIIIFQLMLAFTLFLLLGFRYRIILTLIGIAVIYVLTNASALKLNVRKVLLLCSFLYFLMFITVNRYQFTNGNFTDLYFNPSKLNYELFFEQTRGFIADSIIINHYSEIESNVGHDYGLTMFFYPFLTATPRLILPNKDEFYPPPQVELQKKIYHSPEAIKSGEALLNLGYLVISFGIWGAIIGNFIFGILIKKMEKSYRHRNVYTFFIYFSFLLASFQWITRGYFPQAITHMMFFILPILILMKSLKMTSVNYYNQYHKNEF